MVSLVRHVGVTADDTEDEAHNVISRINEIYTKPNFILYAPPRNEVKEKVLDKKNYYKDILTFFINNPGIFQISNVKIYELKKEMYTTFLLIDGENLLFRLKEYYSRNIINKNDIDNILTPFYQHKICIIIFCPKHSYTIYNSIPKIKNKAKIEVFRDDLLGNSEIDDIMLMYFYIFINVQSQIHAYVLTFDKYSWFDPCQLNTEFVLVEHKKIYKQFFEEVKSLSERRYNLTHAIDFKATNIEVKPSYVERPYLVNYCNDSLSSSRSSSRSSSTSRSSRTRKRKRKRGNGKKKTQHKKS